MKLNPGLHLKTILKANFQGGGYGMTEGHRYDHPDGLYGHKMEMIERIRENFGPRTKVIFTHQEEVEFRVHEEGTWEELCRTVL